uniref:CN hydrolase domain-containing protein n=1 Tax=Chelydra serpentina TaxID=8475 RepID=A0A8C3RXA8_CHESE
MACSQPHVYTAAFILPALKACALDSYVTAVYERSIMLSEDTKIPVSPEDALMLMNKNMDVLEGAIRRAALQGACIIVPPEDGIYGWVFTRETVYSYLEDIPGNWIPHKIFTIKMQETCSKGVKKLNL